MEKEQLKNIIVEAIKLGYKFMHSVFDEKLFIEFDSLKNTIVAEAFTIKDLNNQEYKIFELINNIEPSNFRISWIEKIFYFKIYQYRFHSSLTSNSQEDIYKRYVIAVIEKLENWDAKT